jgi:hypothetical protein
MADQNTVEPNYGPAPKGKANIKHQGQTEGHYGVTSQQKGVLSPVRDAGNLGKDA